MKYINFQKLGMSVWVPTPRNMRLVTVQYSETNKTHVIVGRVFKIERKLAVPTNETMMC